MFVYYLLLLLYPLSVCSAAASILSHTQRRPSSRLAPRNAPPKSILRPPAVSPSSDPNNFELEDSAASLDRGTTTSKSCPQYAWGVPFNQARDIDAIGINQNPIKDQSKEDLVETLHLPNTPTVTVSQLKNDLRQLRKQSSSAHLELHEMRRRQESAYRRIDGADNVQKSADDADYLAAAAQFEAAEQLRTINSMLPGVEQRASQLEEELADREHELDVVLKKLHDQHESSRSPSSKSCISRFLEKYTNRIRSLRK